MPAAKRCPRQHELPADAKVCLTCGWEFPLAGPAFYEHEILETVRVLKRYYYLVSYQGQEYVLSEALEYLSTDFRAQACEKINRHPLAPIDGWFQHSWEGVVYVYLRLPRICWEMLRNPLRRQLDGLGLMGAESLGTLLGHWQQWLELLRAESLVQPAWCLPLLGWEPDFGLLPLNLDLLGPDSDRMPAPTSLLGYHAYAPEFEGLSLNRRLERSSLLSAVQELLCGMPPILWYPDPLSLKGFRGLYTRPGWERLQAFVADPARLPDPAGLYQGDRFAAIRQSNLDFFDGLEHFERGQYPEADAVLARAAGQLMVSTHIPTLQARSAYRQGLLKQALAALEQARRCEPLANQYFLQAEIHLLAQDLHAAISALLRALELCPHYPEACLLLGSCYEGYGEEAKAEAAYERAYHLRKRAATQARLTRLRTKRLRQSEGVLGLSGGVGVYLKPPKPRSSPRMLRCPQGHEVAPDLAECPICEQPLSLAPGDMVSGYTVQKLIAPRQRTDSGLRGGLYLAARPGSSERVVLKEFLVHRQHLRFEASFEHLKSLRHPHLIPLQDLVFETNFAYFVMPYLSGENLAEVLRSRGPLPWPRLRELLLSLGGVLHYLYTREPLALLHADIKPENILLSRTGCFYLLDLESIYKVEPASAARPRLQSYPYAAPEQQLRFDYRSSSYSVAVTVLHAASGLLPELFFDEIGQCLRGWEPYVAHLPAELLETLSAMLAADPKHRPELLPGLFKRWQALPAEIPAPPPQQLALAEAINRVLRLEPGCVSEMRQASQELLSLRRDGMTCFLAANGLRKVGERREALKLAILAQRIEPERIQFSWLAANLAAELEDYKTAISLINKLPPIQAGHPTSLLLLARSYRKLRNWPFAQRCYAKLAEAQPKDMLLQLEVAGFYLESQMLGNAETLLRKLQTLEPGREASVPIYHMLGLVLAQQGQLQEAETALMTAYRFKPDKPELLYDLGVNFYQLKKWEQAASFFERCLPYWPQRVRLRFFLAVCRLELKQFEVAWQALNALVPDAELGEPELVFQRARVLTLLERFDEAEAAYRRLLSLKPEMAVYLNLANLLLIKDEPAEARTVLEAGLQRYPKASLLRKLQARLRHQQAS